MKEDDKPTTEVHSATPLWIASRILLSEHGAEFFSRWRKVLDTFGEDDIHDLRVASRRLREGLALFSPTLPVREAKRLAKRVKQVTRLLGGIRNTDEAFRFFTQLTARETAQAGEEVTALLATLRREREQAHLQLKEELAAIDPAPLEDDFRAVGNRDNLFHPAATDPFMAVAFFAAGAISERALPVRDLLPNARREADAGGQHRLRIAIKKLRYRLELVSPLLKDGYDELHAALKQYQDLLGTLHDIDVFADLVRERLVESAGREALLQVMEKKRRKLFASFIKKLAEVPVDTIGDRARQLL